MKLVTARNFASALGLVILTSAHLATAHECTMSDAAGRYGYTSNGTVINVGPFTAVGHTTLSESGTFAGAQTTSIAGNLVEETIQGTYIVNPDCTGSSTVYVYHGTTLVRTSLIHVVWDMHQNEARAIFMTPGTSISIQFRKMTGD